MGTGFCDLQSYFLLFCSCRAKRRREIGGPYRADHADYADHCMESSMCFFNLIVVESSIFRDDTKDFLIR